MPRTKFTRPDREPVFKRPGPGESTPIAPAPTPGPGYTLPPLSPEGPDLTPTHPVPPGRTGDWIPPTSGANDTGGGGSMAPGPVLPPPGGPGPAPMRERPTYLPGSNRQASPYSRLGGSKSWRVYRSPNFWSQAQKLLGENFNPGQAMAGGQQPGGGIELPDEEKRKVRKKAFSNPQNVSRLAAAVASKKRY